MFKVTKRKDDIIDSLISGMQLHNHSEHFITLLEESGLVKFWKLLVSSDRYAVFEELAIDRALNFYEAATYAGAEFKQIRIGLVALIMTTAIDLEDQRAHYPHTSHHLPMFSPLRGHKLDHFADTLKVMDRDDVKAAEAVIRTLSRGVCDNTVKTLSRYISIVDKHIVDVLKMWILSDNQVVRKYLALGGDRKEYFNHKRKIPRTISGMLGFGHMSEYAAVTNSFMTPLTSWARIKMFKCNSPVIVNQLMKTI